jgi:hypothetical protein
MQEAVGGTIPVAPKEGILIQTTVLDKSSRGHIDCYFEKDSEGNIVMVEKDRVAFVMMNTNENAFFEGDWFPLTEAFLPTVQSSTLVRRRSSVPLTQKASKRFGE